MPVRELFKPLAETSIWLWNVASGKQVQRFDFLGDVGVSSMQFSSDGNRLLSVDGLNIRVWTFRRDASFSGSPPG